MIRSQQLQNLTVEEFCFLYSQSIINEETEKVFKKVLEEQIVNKNKILVYYLSNISEIYHIPLLENIKKNLESKNVKIESSSLGWVPKDKVAVDEKENEKCQKLFEALDENDAVQEIYSNLKD